VASCRNLFVGDSGNNDNLSTFAVVLKHRDSHIHSVGISKETKDHQRNGRLRDEPDDERQRPYDGNARCIDNKVQQSRKEVDGARCCCN